MSEISQTMEQLYRGVLADPYDDGLRLVWADAAQDMGHDGRAEFVRKQIELSQIGPTPRVIDTHLRTAGPDYYWADTETEFEFHGLKVGDRVTVRDRGPLNKKIDREFRMIHNLLVMKVEPDSLDGDEIRLSLKRDDYSKAYPKKLVKNLRKQCVELIKGKTQEPLWFPGHPDGTECKSWVSVYDPWSYVGNIVHAKHFTYKEFIDRSGEADTAQMRLEFNRVLSRVTSLTWGRWDWERGFVSRVECRWGHWTRYGDWLTEHAPITHVSLVSFPEYTENVSSVDVASRRIMIGVGDHRKMRDKTDEEITQYHLHLRWPTIRPDCWRIPEDGDGE